MSRAVLNQLPEGIILNCIRRATQSIYVLDLSGSMKGERIQALRRALISLAGGTRSMSSTGYAVFRQARTVPPSSATPAGSVHRRCSPISAKNPDKDLAQIGEAAGKLDTDNGNEATF